MLCVARNKGANFFPLIHAFDRDWDFPNQHQIHRIEKYLWINVILVGSLFELRMKNNVLKKEGRVLFGRTQNCFFMSNVKFILLISRQGKVRLSKWYDGEMEKDCHKITKDVSNLVIGRPSKLCNFMDYQDHRLIFKRYASLYFILCVGKEDNELFAMELIQHFVEVLDSYFGNVCELDLIFSFHKAYFLLDEVLLDGELQETSKKAILRVVSAQDTLMLSDINA